MADDTRCGGIDDWWDDLTADLMQHLDDRGAVSPAELGQMLHISEAAASSLVSLLAQEGKVRICLVELPTASRSTSQRAA